MSPVNLIILIILFLVTSAIGVVTGSNSLITVPVMFQFGIDERVAVATNMFGLTFMSVGASIPFLRQGKINISKTTPLIGLTIVGSTIGALLVGMVSGHLMKLIVSIAMIGMTVFILLARKPKFRERHHITTGLLAVGYILSFLMAIYGGLYSGGYTTVLTAVFITFFGNTFAEAVAETKLINVFSSLVASIVFAWQGLIDYKLGAILAVTMFVGAYLGAHYATKLDEVWLRRIFLTTVVLLAVKLLWDVI